VAYKSDIHTNIRIYTKLRMTPLFFTKGTYSMLASAIPLGWVKGNQIYQYFKQIFSLSIFSMYTNTM
jgi:hypothetical protein